MSDKKIIIRNCPCFVEGIAIKGMEPKTQTCNNHKVRELTYCANITDCKLKQIVELCKSACIDCTSIKRVTYTQCKDLNNCKTAKILQLLDIQECE